MKRSAVLVALVPADVRTVTSTVPTPAGETVDIDVSEVTVNRVAFVDPNLTPVVPVKFVPVTVTDAPPPAEPLEGEMRVTVGKPAAIALRADRSTIKADRNDLSYVMVEIVDAEGNVVPNVDNVIVNFPLSGEGEIAGPHHDVIGGIDALGAVVGI